MPLPSFWGTRRALPRVPLFLPQEFQPFLRVRHLSAGTVRASGLRVSSSHETESGLWLPQTIRLPECGRPQRVPTRYDRGPRTDTVAVGERLGRIGQGRALTRARRATEPREKQRDQRDQHLARSDQVAAAAAALDATLSASGRCPAVSAVRRADTLMYRPSRRSDRRFTAESGA